MAEEKRYETNTLGTAFYGTGANKKQKALSVSLCIPSSYQYG